MVPTYSRLTKKLCENTTGVAAGSETGAWQDPKKEGCVQFFGKSSNFKLVECRDIQIQTGQNN